MEGLAQISAVSVYWGQFVLVTLGLIFVLWLINRALNTFTVRLSRAADEQQDHAVVQALRSETRLLDLSFFQLTVGLLKWAVLFFAIGIYLPLSFLIFPETEQFGRELMVIVFDPLRQAGVSFVAYIPRGVDILITLLITYYLLRIFRFIARKTAEGKFQFRGFHPEWAMPTYQLSKVAVIVVAFALIFPNLPGYDIEEFRYISLGFGLLASFGLASLTRDVAAGIVLSYMRPFAIGDRIEVDGIVGEVSERNVLLTRMSTIRNESITVPNSNLLGGAITNYTRNARSLAVVLSAQVNVDYEVEWRTVRDLLINAAEKTAGIESDPRPFVSQRALEDSHVRYDLNVYTRQPEKSEAIYSELHANILDFFAAANVSLAVTVRWEKE